MLGRMLGIVACTLVAATLAQAEPVLIVNGRSALSESPFVTDSVTAQLSAYHLLAGNTVTVADAVPGDISGYSQVWDVRYSTAINGAEQSLYLSYLAAGGEMVVVGENSFYNTRNTSVLAFISAAGGGALAFVEPGSVQSVRPPFTGPDSVLNIGFQAPGGVTEFGTGDWITRTADGTGGSGVVWSPGDLVNALDGTLLALFDVDFLAGYAGAREQALARNLVSFLSGEAQEVPEPATIGLFGLGLCGLGLAWRRRTVGSSGTESSMKGS